MSENAVDFSNPESLAAELAAVETATVKAPKEKKAPKPRVIEVSFTADKDIAAGETVTFKYELPKSTGIRGIVAGIPLAEMTDDQLKIEYRNANSVAYKTKKAGRDASKAEERLAACKAEMEDRGISPTARAATPVDAASVAELIKAGKINIEELQNLLNA